MISLDILKRITLALALLTFAIFHAQISSAQSFYSSPMEPIEDCACGQPDLDVRDTILTSGLGTLGLDVVIDSICLNITHSWTGDLFIQVISPTGDSVILSEFNGAYTEDYINSCFSSTIAAPPISGGMGPFTGLWAPDESLNNFNGTTADGDWVLNVCDDECEDVGTVENWSIHFSVAPSCIAPYNVSIFDINTMGATISWDKLSNQMSWDIEIAEYNDPPTGIPTISGHDTTLLDWTGGSECIPYDVYLRSICGPGDTSAWDGPFSFIINVENDECANAIDLDPYINTDGTCNLTHDFYYAIDCITYSSGEIGISMDCPNAANYDIVDDVWFSFTVPYNGYIEMESFQTTSGGTISELYTGSCGNLEPYQPILCRTFLFDKFFYGLTPGETVYFRMWDNFSDSDGTIEFCLKENSCPPVVEIFSENQTPTGARIYWQPGADAPQWQLEIDTANFPETGIPNYTGITDTFFQFADGVPFTKYDVYIRSVCGPGDTSDWEGPFTFESICSTQPLPTYENFYDFRPACWKEAYGGNPHSGPMVYGESNWRDGVLSDDVASVHLFDTTNREWLFSPYYDFDSGGPYELILDIRVAYPYGNAPGPLGADDTIALLVSLDTGQTWQALEFYTSEDSINWFQSETDTIDISSISGVACFAFWASDGTMDDHPIPDRAPAFFLRRFEISEIGSCPVNLTITGDPVSGTYRASNSIIATGTVKDGRNVIFSAPHIFLDPDFKVEEQALFETNDDGCPSP